MQATPECSPISAELMNELVSNVVHTFLADAYVEPSSQAPPDRLYAAEIDYKTGGIAKLQVFSHELLAGRIAVSLLCPSDGSSPEDRQETVLELANIFAGNLKALMTPDICIGFPTVIEPAVPATAMLFEVDGQLMAINVVGTA